MEKRCAESLKKNNRFRLFMQALSFAFSNGYIYGFVRGKIYTGQTKKICVPGLNCYSCPGAISSCPIGALQSVFNSTGFKFSLYVLGFIGMMGILFGRLICGFLCPFGLMQDLLYKLPIFKKIKNLPGHRYLKNLKYAILLIFVVLLPLVIVGPAGIGDPWFCEYICPSGTLFGGIPLVTANQSLWEAAGFRFWWKIGLLAFILIIAIKSYRPFCKYLCPLGALYGLANPISLYRYSVNQSLCINCGTCKKICGMDIDASKNPNSSECIRCGKCKAVCPQSAISSSLEKVIGKNFTKENRQQDLDKSDSSIPKTNTIIKIIISIVCMLGFVVSAYNMVAIHAKLFTELFVEDLFGYIIYGIGYDVAFAFGIIMFFFGIKLLKNIGKICGDREISYDAGKMLILLSVGILMIVILTPLCLLTYQLADSSFDYVFRSVKNCGLTALIYLSVSVISRILFMNHGRRE